MVGDEQAAAKEYGDGNLPKRGFLRRAIAEMGTECFARPMAHGLPLLIAWLKDKANITAVSKLPDDMANRLPLVMVSPAPGGGQGDDYTRTRSLDIDVFAAD